jgi:hypothetical protein
MHGIGRHDDLTVLYLDNNRCVSPSPPQAGGPATSQRRSKARPTRGATGFSASSPRDAAHAFATLRSCAQMCVRVFACLRVCVRACVRACVSVRACADPSGAGRLTSLRGLPTQPRLRELRLRNNAIASLEVSTAKADPTGPVGATMVYMMQPGATRHDVVQHGAARCGRKAAPSRALALGQCASDRCAAPTGVRLPVAHGCAEHSARCAEVPSLPPRPDAPVPSGLASRA